MKSGRQVLDEGLYGRLQRYCDENNLRFAAFVEKSLEFALRQADLLKLIADAEAIRRRIECETRCSFQEGFARGVPTVFWRSRVTWPPAWIRYRRRPDPHFIPDPSSTPSIFRCSGTRTLINEKESFFPYPPFSFSYFLKKTERIYRIFCRPTHFK